MHAPIAHFGCARRSSLFAQMPKGIFPWWSRPEIARNLNLTPAQREQIRATIQQFRPHLLNVRWK